MLTFEIPDTLGFGRRLSHESTHAICVLHYSARIADAGINRVLKLVFALARQKMARFSLLSVAPMSIRVAYDLILEYNIKASAHWIIAL